MGKGKGGIKYWISRLTAGKAIMQMNHMTKRRAIKALLLAKKMLPIPTRVVMCKVSRKPATALN